MESLRTALSDKDDEVELLASQLLERLRTALSEKDDEIEQLASQNLESLRTTLSHKDENTDLLRSYMDTMRAELIEARNMLFEKVYS